MPKKNAKKPTISNPEKKTRQVNNPESYMTLRPSWAFSIIDCEYWCIHEKFFEKIMEKLQSYENMTWQEIMAAHKGGKHSEGSKNHFVDIEDLHKEARNRLEERNMHYDQIFSLRLTGKERVFGFIELGVMRIIWYDPEHEVCPSTKH